MKTLPLTFSFDIKTIRKAVVLLTGEAPTDSEIRKKYLDSDPVEISEDFITSNVGGKDALELCMMLMAFMVSKQLEQEEKAKPPRKGKFQRRLDELINRKKE